jgi:polyhydroxyalkanoate synthesis regulator phasin
MDQLGNDLKKVLQAGIGAVATGLEKAQDAIEDLSKKGEPIYEQAKSAVTDVVDKARKAISESARPKVEDFVAGLRQFSADELKKIRDALDDLTAPKTDEPKPQDEEAPAEEPEKEKAEFPDDETKA